MQLQKWLCSSDAAFYDITFESIGPIVTGVGGSCAKHLTVESYNLCR